MLLFVYVDLSEYDTPSYRTQLFEIIMLQL